MSKRYVMILQKDFFWWPKLEREAVELAVAFCVPIDRIPDFVQRLSGLTEQVEEKVRDYYLDETRKIQEGLSRDLERLVNKYEGKLGRL